MGVEVKSDRDWVSESQYETFEWLTAHDFPVWIWYAQTPTKLWKWERVKDRWMVSSRKRG